MKLSNVVLKVVTGGYLVLFFVYLFLPLIFMSVVAFNTSDIPQVTPWEGFTFMWFGELFGDSQMWHGLINSLIVAFFVVIIAVPIGLGAALLLTRLQFKAREGFYAILVSPLLMPGIILGISTFLFWDQAFQISGGLWTAIMGQSTFISGYCMLLIMARASALIKPRKMLPFDLGATHRQVFWKITCRFSNRP